MKFRIVAYLLLLLGFVLFLLFFIQYLKSLMQTFAKMWWGI
jgi:hypothetical protein